MRLLLLLLPLLAGCAAIEPSVEMGAGYKLGGDWEGDPPVVFINLRGDYKQAFCKLEHISNLGSGAPFNELDETDLTWTACGLRFGHRN